MKYLFLILTGLFFSSVYSQTIRPLSALINKEDSGWDIIQEWKKKATNVVEILPVDSSQADSALYHTQVTTRSPMGSIVYYSGGILIDNGWIRILGSGCSRLNRSLPEWNKHKSYEKFGQIPSFLLIADDVLGGFFAMNQGEFGRTELGKIFYFAPDTIEWENLHMTYSDFIVFCFSGDLQTFYQGMKWKTWKADVQKLNGQQGIYTFPFLWTEEGKNIEKVNRSIVPIQEMWDFHFAKPVNKK